MDDIEYTRRLTEVDARFRARLAAQVDAINRILAGGTYDTEMATLHEMLADVQADRDALAERVRFLERT